MTMTNSLARRLRLGVVALGLLAGMNCPATADVLWYNGDFNGVNSLVNGITAFPTQANAYDDFVVTASSGWTINSVFSNDLMSFKGVTQAEWEIRSGVSAGNGGTLLASGTGAATQVATGRSGFGLTEYTIEVAGLNIQLGPGTYWLTVAPVGSGFGSAFDSNTSGANAVGTPPGNDGNSFFNSSAFGLQQQRLRRQFQTGADAEEGTTGNIDFSMGINGAVTAVPEPSSIALVACACLMGLGYRWTKRRDAPARG